MKPTLPLLLFLACNIFTANAQRNAKPQATTAVSLEQRLQGIDAQLEPLLNQWKAAGFAVSVVHKDKVIWSKGYGLRNREQKLPVTPNTLFAIGSCTKAFTSALVGQLQKDGKLDYDKPLATYLPAFRFHTDALTNDVTVRDLMCHRTGMPRHDFSWYLWPTSRDSLMQRVQHQEASADLRQRWQYNNFMFLAQGVVAEKLTGQSWEDLIRAKFFGPLGMKTANTSVADMARAADAAVGYEVKKDSLIRRMDYYNLDQMGPAGSINSSVLDMANWVRTWINGGKFEGKEVLPAAYVQEAMSSQMVIGAGLPTKEIPDVHLSNYGFGWFLASYRGHYRVEHGGNIDGFSANTSFYPADSVGIVVLVNQNGSPLPTIVRNLISDRILGLPYYDWSSDRRRTLDKAKATEKAKSVISRKMNTQPSHALTEFAGVYSHPGYGTFEVALRRDSLFAQTPRRTFWLQRIHHNIYEFFDTRGGIDTASHSPVRFQFVMNTAGDLDGLHVHGLELTLTEPLEFKKGVKPQALVAGALKKYEGEYAMGTQLTVKVYTKADKTLFALVPGQPDYELVPLGNDRFSIKVLGNYFIQFAVLDSKTTGLTFEQPNGNVKLTRKEGVVAEKK